MSIANSVVSEFLFGGNAPAQCHQSVVSAISSLIDAENGALSYFPTITVLYTFTDGSIVSVSERGVIDHDTPDDALSALGGKEAT